MNDAARQAWHRGIVPQLSTRALLALYAALQQDNPQLVQGTTLVPAPLQCNADEPVQCACAVAFGPWRGDYRGAASVEAIEEEFARICFEADALLGEPGAVRYFLNFWDEGSRPEVVAQLLAEVTIAVVARSTQLPAA